MCGIVGKLKFNGDEVESLLIHKMANTILHRGPDQEGIYTAPHIGLGQRRLSIIDLRRSASAPLPNEDETVWVVFNGEIYNFPVLREELERRGHVFKTSTDTEVIIHLYEDYGIDCLQYLRGMFAFAIWDARKKRLFAARDRFGKKPFYYTQTPKHFIFASEIKAIIADTSVTIEPNYQSIDSYLTNQYVPSPETAFIGIKKLPAATWLTCDIEGNLNTGVYWDRSLVDKENRSSEEEVEAQLLQKLRESVRLRMISDVPLGAFLSGGIDSATIVGLMAMESSNPVKTFSIGFKDQRYNELPYAKILAERFGTEHHEFVVDPSATDILPSLVHHYNEPFADSSALPTFYVSRMTSEHVTVALSGDGGDESFAGYDRYYQMKKLDWLDSIPSSIRSAVCRPIEFALNKFNYVNNVAKASRLLKMLRGDLPGRYQQYMSLVKNEEKQYLYSTFFKSFIDKDDHLFSSDGNKSIDSLEWMMQHDRGHYLPDCLMVKTDVASMMNSLEVRCPFLDHELVEFVSGLSPELKLQEKKGKIILRKAVASFLPEEILNKPKSGFSVPVASWFRNELSEFLQSNLLDEVSIKRNLFDRKYLKKLIDEHIEGRRDWGNRLWALLFLELWFREYID